MDRTYWHVPGAKSWHALEPGEDGMWLYTACGRSALHKPPTEVADRLPPTGHLCQNCGRIIAARTDIEEDVSYGTTVVPLG